MVLHTDYYHNDHINHRISIAVVFSFSNQLSNATSTKVVSCLNVSLQITENCLYANIKKTEKSQWKQQVRQLDSLSKLRRDITLLWYLYKFLLSAIINALKYLIDKLESVQWFFN